MVKISFFIISVLSLLLFYYAVGKSKKLLITFIIWQCIIGSVAIAGLFEKTPILFPVTIVATILVTIFSLQKMNWQQVNPTLLLSVHVLRIPVEILLFQLFLQHKIPQLMTFSGWNFDILIGISALILLLLMAQLKVKLNKQLIIAWNIIGILFLLFIVSISVLSSPLPIQQFAFDQPNIAILEFPYCFLATCIVPLVFSAHIISIKQLNKQKEI